ncbi:hypothetical protein CBS101457_004325 [Exobasidium rhododendri]|nr:hypothetical protein CBS101457_004325 [Exobasidium rhododendri]
MFPASSFLTQSTDPRWVVVANLPREANESWLRMLFAPVGECMVEAVEFAGSEGPGTACLLFATTDQAAASLHFNGFMALGITIQVRPRNMSLIDPTGLIATNSMNRPASSVPSPMTRFRANASSMDVKPTHKNLYVLNLPLDATTDQLTALFSSYGTVVHCVILAMLDAQARRRGFIDMSSPNEAKEAIEGLNGFVWHGYPIEVSYAIVQRSGGPFDQATGRNIIKRNVPRNRFNTGPRRVPSDSALDSSIFGLGSDDCDNVTSSTTFGRGTLSGYANGLPSPGYSEESSGRETASEREEETNSATDPFTIFIAGLDPVAIIDDEDFRHALQPYGTITAATLCRDEQGTSRGFGIVTFGNQDEASQACESINGKVTNGRRLSAHKYVYQTHPTLLRPAFPLASGMTSNSNPTARFNNTPLPPRPSPLQRRNFNLPGGNGLASYPPTSVLQQIPLVNATRLSPRLAQMTPSWPLTPQYGHASLHPTQRLDQIPMGSIGSCLTGSNSELWNSPSTLLRGTTPGTANFFKANGQSRPIEIKPDLKAATADVDKHEGKEISLHGFEKQLGDAFVPLSKIPARVPSSEQFSDATVKNDMPLSDRTNKNEEEGKIGSTPKYAATAKIISLLRTPGSNTSPWSSNSNNTGGVASNSMGLDAMSPESTLSIASSASSISQLNTPEAIRGNDSTTIWGHHSTTSHDRMTASIRSGVSPGSWLSNSPPTGNDKRVTMSGSAILSLQNNDVVEKASNRSGNAMAPVGHEKNSSSPIRVMRPYKDDGETDAIDG